VANPFEKRATEYLRDDEAFLALVSPEPLGTFFEEHARKDKLLDQLVMIIGTPGSGKTTMARLFQYSTITTALQNESIDSHKLLLSSLLACGAIKKNKPAVLGARIPLESEYREFWEFPYPDDLKLGLMTALIQARAVLAWIHELRSTGIGLDEIQIVPRGNSKAATEAIGGPSTADIYDKAAEMERAIYKVSAALVPPPIERIPSDAAIAYRPFDVIDQIVVKRDKSTTVMKPLIILDDAHTLQQAQFDQTRLWLARRELRVARWMITRFDALTPRQVLLGPGMSGDREITTIRMQGDTGRAGERVAFRKMAKDISSRYLRRMDTFNRRGLSDLRSLLATVPEPIAPSKLAVLSRRVDTIQKRNGVTQARRAEFEALVDKQFRSSDDGPDVRLASLAILMERYKVRTRARSTTQLDIFQGTDPADDPEPSVAIGIDAGVVDGARIHLLHEFGRPYYYGIDTLCDSGSENAEQFLLLASVLVKHLETKLIRGRKLTLSAREQDRLLRDAAAQLMKGWNFPYAPTVRALVKKIADECVAKSLEPNASLKGGAIALGIPMSEFEELPNSHPDLARVLQFAVAYNAVTLVQDHTAKNQKWCLIELGGAVLLREGLTLARGGFLERTADQVRELLLESQAIAN
jgi:hypothetical protein